MTSCARKLCGSIRPGCWVSAQIWTRLPKPSAGFRSTPASWLACECDGHAPYQNFDCAHVCLARIPVLKAEIHRIIPDRYYDAFSAIAVLELRPKWVI